MVLCSSVFSCDPEDEFWHSSLITERLDRRLVCSSTGTKYKLTGNIEKSLALAQGTRLVVYIIYCTVFWYWYVFFQQKKINLNHLLSALICT